VLKAAVLTESRRANLFIDGTKVRDFKSKPQADVVYPLGLGELLFIQKSAN